jgi:hypothetical protein
MAHDATPKTDASADSDGNYVRKSFVSPRLRKARFLASGPSGHYGHRGSNPRFGTTSCAWLASPYAADTQTAEGTVHTKTPLQSRTGPMNVR